MPDTDFNPSPHAAFCEGCKGLSEDKEFSFMGTGNADACAALVKRVFPGSESSGCSFNDTKLPSFGNTKFLATSGSYYYTAKKLKFAGQQISLADFKERVANVCGVGANEIPDGKYYKFEVRYCYTATYMYTLITDVYKFTEETWKNVNITKKVDETSVGWSLGLMLKETGGL